MFDDGERTPIIDIYHGNGVLVWMDRSAIDGVNTVLAQP